MQRTPRGVLKRTRLTKNIYMLRELKDRLMRGESCCTIRHFGVARRRAFHGAVVVFASRSTNEAVLDVELVEKVSIQASNGLRRERIMKISTTTNESSGYRSACVGVYRNRAREANPKYMKTDAR